MRRMRGTTEAVEIAAREMRKTQTVPEDVLWSYLRRKQVDGFRFKRQHPMGRFIFDFYCAEKKLVVEVDGRHHQSGDQLMIDGARTEFLAHGGYRVIRFTNDEVMKDIPDVIGRIHAALMADADREEHDDTEQQ